MANLFSRMMGLVFVGLVLAGVARGAEGRSSAADLTIVVGIADICSTNSLSRVGSAYADSVYAAGAVPYLLPATTNAEAIAALVGQIDMLLLAGGARTSRPPATARRRGRSSAR